MSVPYMQDVKERDDATGMTVPVTNTSIASPPPSEVRRKGFLANVAIYSSTFD